MHRHIMLAVTVGIGLSANAVYAQTVPDVVRRLVSTYESRISKAKTAAIDTARETQDEVLQELRQHQNRLTMRALLDEAVAVRDLLKRVTDSDGIDERRDVLLSGHAALPSEARQLVEKYLKDTTGAADNLDNELKNIQEELKAELQPYFEKYTQEGNLEAALFVRQAMQFAGAEPVGTRKQLTAIPDFSTKPDVARGQYQQWIIRMTTAQQDRYSPIVKKFLRELNAALNSETRASNLDAAIKVRDLIKKLEAKEVANSPMAQCQLVRKEMASVSGPARVAIENMLSDIAEIDKEYAEVRLTADKALAAIIEIDLTRTLLEGTVSEGQKVLTEYFHLTRDFKKTQGMHDRSSLRPRSAKACEILDDFNLVFEQRHEAAVLQEKELRQTLVNSLKQVLQTAKIEQQQGVQKALEFAQADFSEGLLAMQLFKPPAPLPDAATEAMNSYRSSLSRLRKQLQEDFQLAKEELVEGYKPIIRQHVIDGEYLEAWELISRSFAPETVTPSIPVKAARHAFSSHLWDAHLIDIRGENSLLIEFGHNKQEWYPRNRVKFSESDVIVVGDRSVNPKPDPPGIPVTPTTKLKPGQKAFKFWGSSWSPVTIQEVGAQSVMISWDGWSPRSEACQRTDLSLLEDQD